MAGVNGTAGLSVSFVTSLADVVPPVVSYLNDRDGRDLFETDHIVVPNAGVRAWLLQQLHQGRLPPQSHPPLRCPQQQQQQLAWLL